MSIISPYNIAVYEDTGWYCYPLYTTNKYFSMTNQNIPIKKYASIPIIIDNKDYYLHIHDYQAYYADSSNDKIAVVTNYGPHWVVKSRNFKKLEFWVTITTTSSKKMRYRIEFSDWYSNLNFFLDYTIDVASLPLSSVSGGRECSDTDMAVGSTYSSPILPMEGSFYKYMSTSATFTFKMKSVFDGTEEIVKTITHNGDNLPIKGGSTTIFFSFDI